jgi:hypothetical protein
MDAPNPRAGAFCNLLISRTTSLDDVTSFAGAFGGELFLASVVTMTEALFHALRYTTAMNPTTHNFVVGENYLACVFVNAAEAKGFPSFPMSCLDDEEGDAFTLIRCWFLRRDVERLAQLTQQVGPDGERK